MAQFEDRKGNKWTISLTVGSAMRVKERLGIDLLQPEQGDPPLLTRIGTDEMLLAQIIAALLESQFEAQQIDAAQVYELFDGDTFGQATIAFYEALIQFFRQRDRKDRVVMIQKLQQTIQQASQEVANKLESLVLEAVAD